MFIGQGGAFYPAGTVSEAQLVNQPLSESDYRRVRGLHVGEEFRDIDGDKWLRIK